jgi:fatty acid-binding protein DegV
MSAVALCTDSSSLLSAPAAARLGVDVVPVPVAIDGEPAKDDVTPDAFFDRLARGGIATTSQPSPGTFALAYERAAQRGAESVLSIHLDGRASGVAASATLGSTAAPIPVRVVDTGTVSYGVAVCVRAAAHALASGGSLADAVEVASREGAGLRTVFVARPRHIGRIPSPEKSPEDWTVWGYEAGAATPLSASGSVADAIATMAGMAAREDGRISVAVGHAGRDLEAAADHLAHRLVDLQQVVSVERYRVGAAVGAHTGPKSFGLFWWPSGE